ncbi:hypothetical protein MTO96_001835 [Rhipicephalus appendiculatus]
MNGCTIYRADVRSVVFSPSDSRAKESRRCDRHAAAPRHFDGSVNVTRVCAIVSVASVGSYGMSRRRRAANDSNECYHNRYTINLERPRKGDRGQKCDAIGALSKTDFRSALEGGRIEV